MNQNDRDVNFIRKIKLNDFFELNKDFEINDLTTIQNDINKFSIGISKLTKEEYINFNNEHPNFKRNIMNFARTFPNYINLENFQTFLNDKKDIDIYIEVSKNNNDIPLFKQIDLTIMALFKNKKIDVIDIIDDINKNFMDYFKHNSVESEKLKVITSTLIERGDLNTEILNHLKENNIRLTDVDMVYENLEEFISKNKNISIDYYKFLDKEMDLTNDLKSYVFHSDNDSHIRTYDIYSPSINNEFINNTEFFKYILENNKNTINNHFLIMNFLDNGNFQKNTFNINLFKILLEHYNYDLTNLSDNDAYSFIKNKHEFIIENNKMIKIDSFKDRIIYPLSETLKKHPKELTDILNWVQFMDSPQTIEVINKSLEIDDNCITQFLLSDDSKYQERIERLRYIFRNVESDFFEVRIKNSIENNDVMSTKIFEELARKNLDNEVTYNDKKRKRKF